jgi:hypothetical protein
MTKLTSASTVPAEYSVSHYSVEVEETCVNVVFHPGALHFRFGRLTDADDVARFGPLSRPSPAGDTGQEGPHQIEHLAYTLAVRAVAT